MNLLMAVLLSVSFSSEAKDVNGHVHGVYAQDGEIFYQEFDGEQWTEPMNLSHTLDVSSHSPMILTKGEIVRALWIEGQGEKACLILRRKPVNEWRWSLPDVIDARGEEEAREFLEGIRKGLK
jgi:hypothetical protein